MKSLLIVLLLTLAACGKSDAPERNFEDGPNDMSAQADGGDMGEDNADSGAAGDAETAPDEGTTPDDGMQSGDMGPVDTSPLEVMDRPATVLIPEDYDTNASYPLIVLLHGYTASGALQDGYLKLSERRTERGFIVVTPDGTTNPMGARFWNASWCCDFYDSGVDDVAYISGLIAEAKDRFNVDDQRVYLIGHSNGGFMSYRMACEVDGIAGIASIAGSGWDDEADCTGTGGTTAVLQIHGTLDATIPYAGYPGRYPGAEEMMARWAARDGCSPDPVEGDAIDIVTTIVGDETTVQTWSGCDDQTTVELWTINGGGHVPSFGATFIDLTLDYLFAHTTP